MYQILPQITDELASNVAISSSSYDQLASSPQVLEAAIFAGGSFCALEAAYGNINGVITTCTGYFGGTIRKPSYKDVCAGETGHTEAVKVVYNNRTISFASLCDIFWDAHDPTNKDYLKFGLSTHQRPVIFYSTNEERKEAQESKIRRQMKLNKRIVTKILPTQDYEFYLAENQHQKYNLQNHYRLCGHLELRSTRHFVDSHLACKLNGILGMSEEKQIIDELTKFVNIQELPNNSKSECLEIIQDLRTAKTK